MKSLFIFFLLLITPSFAQRQVLLSTDSTGWAYARSLDENNQQVDPLIGDPDFFDTWQDQSFGDYFSPLTYDGPAFITDQQAPFFAGTVPGIPSGTSIDLPDGATWDTSYFMKVVDGGEFGYQNLIFTGLARDGAQIFINGKPVSATPNALSTTGANFRAESPGDGITFEELFHLPIPQLLTLRPGPNLITVVVARVPTETEDFGLKLEFSGEPGLPTITPPLRNLIGNRLHLRWATPDPQKTLVRITNLTENTTQVFESDVSLRNHYFTRELPAGTTFRYEILTPDLEVWEGSNNQLQFFTSESLTTPKLTILDRHDTDWHSLLVRDSEGNDIDPALSDPDFNQTWFSHTPAGFGTPPFQATAYDGPSFLPASTPIHYGAAADFPNAGTELASPTGGEGHTLWLLRTIDGGGDGFSDLELEVTSHEACFFYLNGELIAETIFTPDNDLWNSNTLGFLGTSTETLSLRENGRPILNPGPNLLAVSVHTGEGDDAALGFSLELKGAKRQLPEIRDFQEDISGTTFRVSYLTGTLQPTLIHLGTNPSSLESFEIPGDRVFHQFELSNLKGSSTYHYEVRRGDGSPFSEPITGTFTTPDPTFVAQSASDWQILHSLDSEGLGIDPALADPDFNSTWMTLGMASSIYDGPTFTPNQTTPIRISGGSLGTGGTVLANPGADRSGAIYLVREVTGPPKGTSSLDFDISHLRSYRLYLNGRLVIDNLRSPESGSAWDLYKTDQPILPSNTPPIFAPGILVPGKNILAISLHAYDQNDFNLNFDMALTGVSGSSDTFSLGDPVTTESGNLIQWFTATPTSSLLRYGSSRTELTNTLSLPDPTNLHFVTIPRIIPGQRVYYEILKADGSSFEPPSINSFVGGPETLIPFASQWSHLLPRDPEIERSIDPALLDPDFYETWSTQSLGSYPGNTTYDGPAFSPLLPAPFGPASNYSPPGTITPHSGPIWFLREIDGGLTGYHQLQFLLSDRIPITIFLNGHKIGDTVDLANSQAIWAQRGGSFSASSFLPSPDLVLPPGPNLLAIQLHSPPSFGLLTFDLELSGLPLTNTPPPSFALSTTASSLDLAWSTPTAQASQLRWGLSPASLDTLIAIPGDRIYHTSTLTDLTPATIYYAEVLDAEGNSFTPPVISSFLTQDQIILSRQSSDWSLLEHIIDGAFTNPALSDPDFIDTWHTPSSYDGPAFLPNQTAPFIYQGHLRVGQTELQSIDQRIRPVWLLKEIDGGDTGYQSLTFNANYNRGCSVFLNGELILSPGLTNLTNPSISHGSWLLAAFSSNGSSSNTNFSQELPESVILAPGTNTLAISLHPYRFDLDAPLIGEFELTGIPIGLQITPPVVTHLSSSQVELSWESSELTSYRLSYGLSPTSPSQVIDSTDLRTNNLTTLENLTEGGTYTYEIHATTQSGKTAITVGTFEILPQLVRQPFLQKASPSSMTINWRTRDPVDQFLVYGTDPANLDRVISATASSAPFSFTLAPGQSITDQSSTLTGLSPATKYYYQIASDQSSAPASDLNQFFTTPPLPGTPAKTRIWVVGDSGLTGQGVRDVKDAYLQYTADTPTDLWLMLGDNAYNSGTDTEYQAGLFDIFPELLKNTPVWPTLGNHDSRSNGYYNIFTLPTNGQSGGVPSGTEQYYSFDHGNIHFICLNSEEDPDGMLEWLETDLQSTRADWIIAFFHHGPYTKGSHDSDRETEHFRPRQNYLPILENYGVDLVLSGHSHQYERSHLLDGHYGLSSSYRIENHALDLGPGSPFGATSRTTGLFQYTTDHTPYTKTIATPNSGQVSATVGASSRISSWSDTGYYSNRNTITHPNPHPVHVATIRALGSMVIDIEGRTLHASYLDSNGQIRDHFQINKAFEESPAITWWQENFGSDSYPYFADWNANPDRDTHDNRSEFVLGGDPLQNDSLIEATLKKEALGDGEPQEWFAIEYDLREGSEIIIEASENLITYSTFGIETRRLTEPNAQGTSRWESRVLREDQRTLFFRLEVSR